MFGQKLLDNSRVRLDQAAHDQFGIVQKEMQILCDKTGMIWDTIADDLFDKVRTICFAEGIVCGALITGVGIATGVLIAKHAIKPKE